MTAKSADEAVSNGRSIDTYAVGMCQKYVRGPCWEVGSLYGSAIEAWNGAREKHHGDRNPPKGAPCYYSGGSYGHAVLSVGGGRIRSTDCTSATYVNDAALSWPEQAWGYQYLGWTGDINGVDLPLSGDDDMALSTDDVNKVADAVWQRMIANQTDAPDGRKAGPTLAGVYNHTLGIDDQVWDRLIKNQTDAPEGRKAGPTLAGIYNMVLELARRPV
jgi:hypothetical protein